MKRTLLLAIFALGFLQTFSQCDPFAGSDAQACGNTCTLEGSGIQVGSTVLWTSTTANVLFSDPDQLITEVTIIPYTTPSETVSFILTETAVGGSCVDSDTIVVVFKKKPHAEAGVSQNICGAIAETNADTLGTNVVSGEWTTNVTGVTFTNNGTGPVASNSTVNAIGAFAQFVNHQLPVLIYWTVAGNNGCEATDSVLITFRERPHAEAGPTQSVCGTLTEVHADTLGSNIVSAEWTSDITGISFTNNGSGPVPSYSTVDASGAAAQFVNHQLAAWVFWTGTAQNGCEETDSLQITFYETPQPNAGPDQTVTGSYVLLTATQTAGTQGQWSSQYNSWYDASVWPGDTVLCPTCKTQPSVVYYNQTGSQTVSMIWTEINGSCNIKDTVVITFNPSGIGLNQLSSELVLFPNPANAEVFISQLSGADEIEIMNSAGIRIIHKTDISSDVISTNELSNGMYFVIVRKNNQEYHSKFVVKH